MTHEQKPESAALNRVKAYLLARKEKPIRQMADGIHEVHLGDEYEASLTIPDLNDVVDMAEQRREDAEGAERWEFEAPEYHAQGMGCGLEDRGIHDRYQAMEYGWDQAIERCIELIPEELYTRPADVAALEARVKELEACEKDAARFRWLVENIRRTPIAITWDGFGFLKDDCVIHQSPSLSSAIDAAMDEEAAAIREGGEHG